LINGSKVPFNKQIWFPAPDDSTDIEKLNLDKDVNTEQDT